MIGIFPKQIKTQQNLEIIIIIKYLFKIYWTPPDLPIGKNTKNLWPEKGRPKAKLLYPKYQN